MKPGRVDRFSFESKRTTAQGRTEKKVFDMFRTTHLKLVLFCLLFKMFTVTAVTAEAVGNPHRFTSHRSWDDGFPLGYRMVWAPRSFF